MEQLSDIVIEADADMRSTIKNWNLGVGIRGRAYELADAVAWFNQKGVKIPHCVVRDLRGDITDNMKRYLLK